jgi:ribonuclease-3
LPEYNILDKSGLEHNPIFKVSVSIKDFKSVTAIGSNLKNAEETAASKLLSILKNKINLKDSGYNNFE